MVYSPLATIQKDLFKVLPPRPHLDFNLDIPIKMFDNIPDIRRFPPEIRALIFAKCLPPWAKMWQAWDEGQNIIEAFCPEPELYFEIIHVFYKIKTFPVSIFKHPVTSELRSTLDYSSKTCLERVRTLFFDGTSIWDIPNIHAKISHIVPKLQCLTSLQHIAMGFYEEPRAFDVIFPKFLQHCPKLRKMSASHPLFANGEENPELVYIITAKVAKHVGDSVIYVPGPKGSEWHAWEWNNDNSAE